MRTSASQQAKTRRRVIETAVELMTLNGFEGTTMKQIARAADVGDATIYKYFPNKEKLIGAYFEQAIADALVQWKKAPWQKDLSLQEHMQVVVDALLENLLPDREFVAMARAQAEHAPVLLMGEQLPGKQLLKEAFIDMLNEAEANAEIVPCSFKPNLSGLLADYVYGVIAYWLRDESEQFANTTQFVDLTLGVVALSLRTGVVDKLLELCGFVVRSQLARLMKDGNGLLDLLQMMRHSRGTTKHPG